MKSLALSGNPISNISFLQGLTALPYLYTSDNQIDDISSLQDLSALRSLNLLGNPISNISFLQGLTALESLNLCFNEINDISSLRDLTALQLLDLSHNKISNISFLQGLTTLRSLNLSHNEISYFDETFLAWLPQLNKLKLSINPVTNVLPEIINQRECLTDLRNYLKDRTTKTLPLYESKIVLVGNGRVGKTCLLKRMSDKTFNSEEPSTHAIQLREWPQPELAADTQLKEVQLNIWDFGGQDIYHATHRLFLQTQALFLLVWDAETEETPVQTEDIGGKKVSYKNRSLRYWLSYIKTQSSNGPVIIVQTKRDQHGKKEPELIDAERRHYNVKSTVAVE